MTTNVDGVTITAVSWFDNKIVNMVSTYAGSHPVIEKKRFFKSENRHKIILSKCSWNLQFIHGRCRSY